jgi:transcriptional regulator with PAS, ATPase and Fis domain
MEMRQVKKTYQDGIDSAIDLREKLVGSSESFKLVKMAAVSVAKRRSTVLILGETGTGKQMLAQHIHKSSKRADKPFVPVDCLALTETLFESELFGHTKGAFTGAVRDSIGFVRAAHGGTLFLDEIGDLSLRLQGKLLRLLQEQLIVAVGDINPQKVDVRIIAATNKNLHKMAQEGTFREDLFFRLNVVTLTMPPLRERPDDILALAGHFLAIQTELYKEQKKKLSPEAASALCSYNWPGNIRQLANVMEHAYVLTEGQTIYQKTLPPKLQQNEISTIPSQTLTLNQIEREAIIRTLKHTRYHKAEAARLLGVNYQRFNRLIKRLQIELS